MNKTNVFCLLVCASLTGACFKKAPTSNMQTTQPSATAAPVAEKTSEPGNQSVAPPGDDHGDYNAAMNFLNAKSYDKAAAEFEAVVKKDPKNRLAYLNLARSYKGLNKSDQTAAAYKKTIELKPDDAEANYELGRFYMNKKDFEASLPYIQKAAKINYKSAEYLVALGDNYREVKKCEYAMPPYGNSLGFQDKNPAAYYGMGLCYVELNNKLAAQQQLTNLEKVDKDLAKKLADKIPK